MYRTVDEVCQLAEHEAKHGRLSRALDLISEIVSDVINDEGSFARVFSSRHLDQTCLNLGRGLRAGEPEARDPDRAVFLVTALYQSGGHSRVLLDIARADPCKAITVLITNRHHDFPKGDFESVLSRIGAGDRLAVEVAPFEDAAGRLRWLQERLSTLRPTRTYLLQHNQDSVCIAAAQPELVGDLFYIHHCNTSLALGVHIPHATHVDLAPKVFYHCRDNEGLSENVVWAMAPDVPCHRGDRPFLTGGKLKTCTCGTPNKFDAGHLREQIPYSIKYADIVPVILSQSQGIHFHIGTLSEPMLQEISDRLAHQGISPSQFVHIPYVPDLAAALLEHEIDAYIGSFPHGGGRATVEAMGAGLPLILHSNYRTAFFSPLTEAYEGAMSWRTPDELAHQLGQLTEQDLKSHSGKARRHFEKNYSHELLCKNIREGVAPDATAMPPRPIYYPDMLQAYLDEQSALESRLSRLHGEIQGLQGTLLARDSELQRLRDMQLARDLKLEELEDTSRRRDSELERLQDALAARESELKTLQEGRQQHIAAISQLIAELVAQKEASLSLEQALHSIHNSRFWRLTGPLRGNGQLFVKLRRKLQKKIV
jgi:hypothetical protein